MFRFCSFCQHLIGQTEPFDNHMITHGCCAACEPMLDAYVGPEPRVLEAQKLLNQLMKAGARADNQLEEFMEEARRSGLAGLEILFGVIQPALYEIGARWERGEATVGDEHRFTEFCLRVYAALGDQPRPTAACSILLALAPGNRHDIGARMLERAAAERGVGCRLLPPGLRAEEIVTEAMSVRPALLGLSVALPESLSEAERVFARCAEQAPSLRFIVGGRAARNLSGDTFAGARIIRRLEDFSALDSLLRP